MPILVRNSRGGTSQISVPAIIRNSKRFLILWALQRFLPHAILNRTLNHFVIMAYKDITPPAGGKISIQNGKLNVPENPILPFIRGDGTGPDIWAASVRVFDAAVQKAYGGKRKVSWF